MRKFRHILLTLALTLSASVIKAQDNEVGLGIRGGYNAAFGGFGSISVVTRQNLHKNFRINAGARYNTMGKTAAEARPTYLYDFDWGRFSTEALVNYTNLASISSISIGAGAGISGRRIGIKFGYYYRMFGNKAGFIKEPFNIYYELRTEFLPEVDDWGLQFLISNSEMLELERHYQPSFILQANHYIRQHLGLNMGIGCKPAGMFNMSADNYESYLKFGICYRW